MNKRIVVTGIGVITSIGIGRDEFWNNLIQGKSGISEITSFDTIDYPTHRGGEIKNFKPQDFLKPQETKTLGRASSLAASAAKLAVKDARINLDNFDKKRIGLILGTTMAESQILEIINDAWVKKGQEYIDANLVPTCPANIIPANVAKILGLQGPHYIIPTACAAGNYAIGYACDLLKKGTVGMMLAGGTDGFSRIAFTGFNRLLATAPEICQPFDKNRKGMIVGEGAGIVLLESLESALNRGADIYAEILGYGLSCDANHMTAPDHRGISKAIEKALQESRLLPDDIDYINAHGTGTPANDKEECLAIKRVFADYYKKIPVSSIKSMLGHTMGAASAIEAITCCLVVKNDIIPPTINFQTPDPECDIDCVPNIARRQRIEVALNNASAFGGNNACLAVKKIS